MMTGRWLTRRHFLKGLLGGPLLFFFFLQAPKIMAGHFSPATVRGRGSIAQYFRGEELVYEIGFWMFRRVALGRLSFVETEQRGKYRATLHAETQGIVGWLSHYRSDTYSSTLEEIEGGSRLRPLLFEEKVRVGSRVDQRVIQFDYGQRKWITVTWGKDGTIQRVEEKIPSGKVYDDFLTASYNFRYGAYGAIEKGKTYSIPAVSRKGATCYELRVASEDEEREKKKSEKAREGKEIFVQFLFDPEITHSKEGRIEGWLSKEFLPVEGRIKEVSILGDVKGTLMTSDKQRSE
jgi:hypothetical protein